MKRIEIGRPVFCDLNVLVNTRLLVQANSGAGKSWLLRRILEQSHGQLQHLVIDLEGEFASLRERYDYVLAAKTGGDVQAHPKTAGVLAERLLELGVSAILDIYELKHRERIEFVARFCDGLINAPKRLWHRALVVVDEAHVFAPEKDEAESSSAVIDLCTRGRKRGFCALLATQRLSKLSKDAAAECNNKLIGRAALDVDMKRAAAELGFADRESQHRLRTLEPGQFFAFGPALSPVVTDVTVGPVVTKHPKAGSRLAGVVPPPTDRVRAVLSKLSDIPEEVETRQRTMTELQAEVTRLKRELSQAQRAQPKAEVKTVERLLVTDAQIGRLEKAINALDVVSRRAGELVSGPVQTIKQHADGLATALRTVRQPALPLSPPRPMKREPVEQQRQTGFKPQTVETSDNGDLPPGERKVLQAVAGYSDGIGRKQLIVLTGYKKSSVNQYLSRLATKGHIEVNADRIIVTESGMSALGPGWEPLPTGPELLDYWRRMLPDGEKRILDVVIDQHPRPVSRPHIESATGYKKSSVNQYISRLVNRRVVTVTPDGVTGDPLLF